MAGEGEGGLLELLVVDDQVETQDEQNDAVTHVAEHDSEEEGEGDCCEDGGVYLFIAGDAVGIGDLLGDDCVAVCVEGGWGFRGGQFLDLGGGRYVLDSLDQVSFFFGWQVNVSYDEVFSQQHFVEALIDDLFFPEVGSPGL